MAATTPTYSLTLRNAFRAVGRGLAVSLAALDSAVVTIVHQLTNKSGGGASFYEFYATLRSASAPLTAALQPFSVPSWNASQATIAVATFGPSNALINLTIDVVAIDPHSITW